MTEEKIERWVEKQINALDRVYLNPAIKMTTDTYNKRTAAIDDVASGMRRGEKYYLSGFCA